MVEFLTDSISPAHVINGRSVYVQPFMTKSHARPFDSDSDSDADLYWFCANEKDELPSP
jgi:hypothetical protein